MLSSCPSPTGKEPVRTAVGRAEFRGADLLKVNQQRGGINICPFCCSNPQMSESRVSSVIQEWAYPGQGHPQQHQNADAGSSGQLPQLNMIPYNQSQGLVRGGADDRMAEQMMGLSYLPYPSSCISATPSGGNHGNQQHHSSAQQVTSPPLPPTPCLDLTVFVSPTSRTTLRSFFPL